MVEDCPYPGLAAFGADHARWFYGRDRQIAELSGRLDQHTATGGAVVVVAPSGAGKSSLLHAGLLPALARGALPGSSGWPRLVLTPTAHPLAALAEQIAASAESPPRGAEGTPAPANAVPDPDGYLAALQNLRTPSAGSGQGGPRVVVVVDQLEELFTLCSDEQERQAFFDLLSRIASPASDGVPVGLVVLGLRADFYARCASYPQLRAALQDSQLFLGPMNEAELREAILYPAQDVGLDIEPGLVEVLLRDLGVTGAAHGGAAGGPADCGAYEAGRLPLLAHALRATWQQRHGHTMAVEGYRTTGGIRGAVATTADRVFTRLDPTGQQAARTVFLRLVRLGDAATEDTRRRVTRAGLLRDSPDPAAAAAVVDAFTGARLLTQRQDAAGEALVEITHEALVRVWPRLREWTETDRAGNLSHQALEDAAAAWDRNRGDTAALYRGSRLEAAQTWSETTPNRRDISPAARAFLSASIRLQRLRRILASAAVAAVVVAAVVAGWQAVTARIAEHEAQRQQLTATVRALVLQANAERLTNPRLSAQLSVAALRLDPGSSDARASLLAALTQNPLTATVTAAADTVRAVAWTRDGTRLAAGSQDHTVSVWDMQNPAHPVRMAVLKDAGDWIDTVAWNRDGTRLAGGGRDGQLLIWDLHDLTRPTLDAGMPGPGEVRATAWSPDGNRIAAGGDNGTISVWDVHDPGRPVQQATLAGHTAAVTSLAWSLGGTRLASGSYDFTARLWDVRDPARPIPQATLTAHRAQVYAVAWSPDGNLLATGGGFTDKNVIVWDARDPVHPVQQTTLTGHTNEVESVAWSPDGRRLASASIDRTVGVWKVSDFTREATFTGHTDGVFGVAWSPDSAWLASGGVDHTVAIWSTRHLDHPDRAATLTGHAAEVVTVAWSNDGGRLASSGVDQAVIVWTLGRPGPPAVITGPDDWVWGLAWNADGTRLAAGSVDRTVWLWDVRDPYHPVTQTPLTGFPDGVTAVAWSPDGTYIAAGTYDHQVWIWDVRNPEDPDRKAVLTASDWVRSVAWSPDSSRVASGSNDGMVAVWDVHDLSRPVPPPVPEHTEGIRALAWSPDGAHLASGAIDGIVTLWDVRDPSRLTRQATLGGHTEPVDAVAWSPDSIHLATGGRDRHVIIWDVHDPVHPVEAAAPLAGHFNEVSALAWNPDGAYLASGSDDHTVILWDSRRYTTATNDAIGQGCIMAGRGMAQDEWQRHVPGVPYHETCSS